MTESEKIEVEVAYALPDKQKIYTLLVDLGTTVIEAVKQSNVKNDFPDVDLEQASYGIFGQKIKSADTHVLKSAERVEIYRPLIADPKEIRRRRAKKNKEA